MSSKIARNKRRSRIEAKLEDLRGTWTYGENYFDFIYARLVLHYLPLKNLETVLHNFAFSLKSGGRLFIVVRSKKNIPQNDPNVVYDPNTRLTTLPNYEADGSFTTKQTRYFHTPKSIAEHLTKAGFTVGNVIEYEEQLYSDFARKKIAPHRDHLIEVLAIKP